MSLSNNARNSVIDQLRNLADILEEDRTLTSRLKYLESLWCKDGVVVDNVPWTVISEVTHINERALTLTKDYTDSLDVINRDFPYISIDNEINNILN